MYEDRLKVILLLQAGRTVQVCSHDFEPNFIIFFLKNTARPAQMKTNHQTLTSNKHLSLLNFWRKYSRVETIRRGNRVLTGVDKKVRHPVEEKTMMKFF